MESTGHLRVLTFNCWGLKYVSKYRSHRINAIAHQLGRSDYDIIALQELWVYSDYEGVRESVSRRLPHSKFFYSGALGAGLAVFSRFPIIEASVYPYSLNGAPLDVVAGDWFVGKAASSIVVTHPILGQLQIFNTHIFAKGGEGGPEHRRAHRLVNAWELAKLTRQAAELGRYVIAAGDYNSIPTSLAMTIIRDYASLSDSWALTHPSTPSPPSSPISSSPQEAIHRYGVTCDSPVNSFSSGKNFEPYARKHFGKRLDYILFRQPHQRHQDLKSFILKAKDSKVVFTDRVPGTTFSYSDHFGLETTFEITIAQDSGEGSQENPMPSQSPPPLSPPPPALSATSVTATLQALTSAYRLSRSRSRRELIISGLCILLLLSLIVTSNLRRISSLNPLFTVLAVFVAWLATTLFYEGFIFGHWELNALMNVIEELEIYRKGVEATQVG